MRSYGYFDDDAREYVVTTPATPIKWSNYVGTLRFGGVVDTTGGSLICKGDPALNRITKYLAWLPASDFKGSTIYIRIARADAPFALFSPFVTPTLGRPDRWECHVGLSYMRWLVEFYDLRVQITIFVPAGSSTLLQDIRVTNIGSDPLAVDVCPVYEFSHFDALKQLTNADWVPQTMTLRAHREPTGHLVLEQYAFMRRDVCVNYVTADGPVASFEGDRRIFLGDSEMGSWAHPLSLDAPSLSNSECVRGNNVAALLIPAGPLAPGATFRTCTQLGQDRDLNAARTEIARFRDLENVDAALRDLASFWERYLQTLQVRTPDAAFNTMLNVHNPRQCHTTKNWSRYLSLHQLGYGSDRGIGFRDTAQDLLGVMSHMPEEAIELALDLLSVQRRDGSAMHQYAPSTMVATMGEAPKDDPRLGYYGDDHLWIVLTVAAYLRETGNVAVLDKVVPFYEKHERSGLPLESGTVWEHLCRALRFTWGDRGRHGLPHAGYADWNDTVNLPAGSESLFNANLFGAALRAAREVAAASGYQAEIEEFRRYYDVMMQAVNAVAWDGAWWIRYFDQAGDPLGSHANRYGKLFTNGQSWPIISGFAGGRRALQAMDSVYEIMNTRHGIKLSWPSYRGYDAQLGGVTTYPPGAKENGGIFLHANPWAMIAECLLGRGDRAYQYYRQINPAAKNDSLDEYESEPYCYPQNILGDEHPQFGLARNAWLSGTSAWCYVAATQWILGIRPTLGGLIVDPCLPAAWDGFDVVRRWRGATYRIAVRNPHHVCKGVQSLRVDGDVFDGNLVPIQGPGNHLVEVTMG